jgi:hypothetical protein
MSTIITLALTTWETVCYHPVKDCAEYAEIMRDTNILSHLTTFVHNGDAFCDFILSQRPVERLCRPDDTHPMDDSKLDGPIRNIPRTLSYLFTYNFLHWLPIFMNGGIEPYRNLRFIGMLNCTGDLVRSSRALQVCNES